MNPLDKTGKAEEGEEEVICFAPSRPNSSRVCHRNSPSTVFYYLYLQTELLLGTPKYRCARTTVARGWKRGVGEAVRDWEGGEEGGGGGGR